MKFAYFYGIKWNKFLFYSDPKITAYELHKYLETYGIVIRIRRTLNNTFIVDFDHTGTTYCRLSTSEYNRDTIYIEGYGEFITDWLDSRVHSGIQHYKSRHKKILGSAHWIKPPDENSPNIILNTLNDDCIHHIFEKCIDDLVGLCELGEVCPRFRSVAWRIFKAKYKSQNWYEEFIDENNRKRYPLTLIERFFKIFGDLITTWNVPWNDTTNSEFMHALFGMYCTNLESLDFNLNSSEMWTIIGSITNHVKRIHLKRVDCRELIDLNGIITACPHLESLKITSTNYELLVPKKIPKLKELILQYEMGVDKGFFEQNTQLEKLTFAYIHSTTMNINNILKLLPNLQSLYIYNCFFYCKDFDCFGRLQKLKDLRIGLENYETKNIFEKIVKYGIQLETLWFKIHCFYGTTIPNIVRQMKSLKCLSIHCKEMSDFYYDLPSALTELTLENYNSEKIVELLEHSNPRLRKVCFVFSHEKEISEQKLQAIRSVANRNGLPIKVILSYDYPKKDFKMVSCIF